ncbi:MAG: hypothetical protein JXN60_09275 [Lentisphaerae bacterium]|nr:hypothetical protein [Lentisphaerota bacterium]
MPNLDQMTNDELLNMRFCDLDLHITGTWIETCIEQLRSELTLHNISFHPTCFLADEWLCPDNEPVVGIAFFLAHPRLCKLEKEMMLEAEGGTKASCMQLLRHETGHALNYAYGLYRRKKWRKIFGPFSKEYPDRYRYQPYSKRYVRHLDDWYAQYHPDEDFAETFAVWLDPKSDWRNRYARWKAIEKLEYVDDIARDITGKPPIKNEGVRYWDVASMKTTLRTYYKRKQRFYAEDYPDFHDFHLRDMFPMPPGDETIPAHKIIQNHRRQILQYVASCSREKKYVVAGLLKDLSSRCRNLNLYAVDNADATMRLAVYVTALTMNYSYTGSFRKNKK